MYSNPSASCHAQKEGAAVWGVKCDQLNCPHSVWIIDQIIRLHHCQGTLNRTIPEPFHGGIPVFFSAVGISNVREEIIPESLHFPHYPKQISLMTEYISPTEVVPLKTCRVA